MIKASCYSVSVNSENPDPVLGGFVKRVSSSCQIGSSDLYVKILWLEFDGKPLVIIGLDTLYFSKIIADKIEEYCLINYGIGQQNIIFNATHTHAAPNTDLPFFGKIDVSYRDTIINKIMAGIDQCHQNTSDAELIFRVFPVGKKIIGRRKVGRDIRAFFLKRKMLMLANEKQEVDSQIRTIEVCCANGTRIATLINFSCHPVFANNKSVSSDFPGQITSRISSLFGGEAIFVQGFCGDVRPNYTTRSVSPFSPVKTLKSIFNGRVFSTLSQHELDDFCTDIVARVKDNHLVKEEAFRDVVMINKLFKFTLISQSGKMARTIEIKIVKISYLIMISIPAEVNVKYLTELKKLFVDYTILPMGFAQGIIGYLPFFDEVNEGGYEVSSAPNYGWDSPLSEKSCRDLFSTIIVEVDRVIKKS